MSQRERVRHVSLLCTVPAILAGSAPAVAATVEQARAAFRHPQVHHSSGPLWVWNDRLTDEQITSTLRDLHSQHVRQVFVHPRPGLMTPYMSDEWMHLWRLTLDEAERLGMLVWIYDENSYPSGFAGGLVPDALPEAVQKGMVFHHERVPSPLTSDTLAVFRLTGTPESGDHAEEITERVRRGDTFTTGTYLTVKVEKAGTSPWFGGKSYVDLLDPAVTRKFLEVTLEPYRKLFGERFGNTIPGSFTDEPNLRVRDLVWTPRLPEHFRERWGYDLIPNLVSLTLPIGDWKRVRHNYWQLVCELFVENWAKPYHDYCARHGLELTGHYWDHEWPNIKGVPDNMAMYAWQQRPAVDCLMNSYAEHTHAQFGNARMVRELASVANQLGRPRTLCEIYGAGGWDLRFEDMKRIADWNAVLGVNTFNEHLSYITIRGARKRDHPQSFSRHAPWWPDYHVVADYLTRLSAALSQGEQVNRILLLQPTTTAWLYQDNADAPDRLKRLGDEFQNLLNALERAQVEYDIGSEYLLAQAGAVEGKELKVGRRLYHTLVLPPLTENLNGPTLGLLEQFGQAGGRVIACSDPPALLDGQPSDRATSAASAHNWKRLSPTETVAHLRSLGSPVGFELVWEEKDNGLLFHQRRKLADGELLFLVNTSIDQPARGRWKARAAGAETWDPATGRIEPTVFQRTPEGIEGEFALPPCGSRLIVFVSQQLEPVSQTAAPGTATLSPRREPAVRRLAPNVLPLDFVDLKVQGEVHQGIYFYRAAQKVFRKHGVPGNPWEKAVQFKDEILRTAFPADSGFEATYRFRIGDQVPDDLAIVIERPDLYRITCNGQPVLPSGEWWLDPSFGKISLKGAARPGENRVTIAASPLTVWHELEPAYVLGGFSLEADQDGFLILAEREPGLGSWREQGMPFYSDCVSYTQSFDLPEVSGRYSVALGRWHGSVARVLVNGKRAGAIAWAPWECDITEFLRPGENRIEVVVVSTPRNLLGPHHSGKIRGSAWPDMFHAAPESGPPPGRSYDLADYGLFEPFRLVRR